MERDDDFETRRKHLAGLSEDELEKRFWDLAGKLTDPIIELARTHTTPSIERSVLLRMGFSSIEAASIVKQVMEHDLLSKGAGHVVYKTAQDRALDIRQAGLLLGSGQLWETAASLFTAEREGTE